MDTALSKNEEIVLWPEGAPGSEDWTQVEEETTIDLSQVMTQTSTPPSLKVVRNVTQPSLKVYPADPVKANGTAVIVCPGGAWHFLSIDMEGTDVARWLAARGVTAFVLRYRLLRTGNDLLADVKANFSDRTRMTGLMQELQPLNMADGRQAVRLVRERAAQWGIAPGRVGMLGFSAGGAFTVSAALNNRSEDRPDFIAPIYPAVFDEPVAPSDAAPMFLLCAQDDDMASTACIRLYSAWKAVGRPVELHIYTKGGHGFGMTQQGLPSDAWIERFGDWLRVQGLCEKP